MMLSIQNPLKLWYFFHTGFSAHTVSIDSVHKITTPNSNPKLVYAEIIVDVFQAECVKFFTSAK